jgi:glutamate-1-semialdehyde 2,1-aminomutase
MKVAERKRRGESTNASARELLAIFVGLAHSSAEHVPPSPQGDAMRERAHALIPGGAHTYSTGDDQFPALAPGFIQRGKGTRVWDVDGNEFLDWGMGLRSVVLGHAYPRVVDAAKRELDNGSNFTRPSPLEAELAEILVDRIPAAEMVKFAKNGSAVTTAAVRLARAATGRDLVAFPREHPFYSVDDWFIGKTKMNAGVPQATQDLSLNFGYGDLESAERLFAEHPGQIAAVITEAATGGAPPEGFLKGLRALTEREGALLIFDEMITGFRWHAAGAQSFYGVTPDMATFGKAIGNGFSVSALVGRRDVMDLGGLEHDQPRVFLLSTTHGGETHALAAARETVLEIFENDVVDHLWRIGELLQEGLRGAARDAGLASTVRVEGYPCSPLIAFDAEDATASAGLRTLFLQEMVKQNILIPYVAPSFSHTDADVERTIEAARTALGPVAAVAGGEPLENHLVGPVARPVFRTFNAEF